MKKGQPKKPLSKNDQLIQAVMAGNLIRVEDLIQKEHADPHYVSGKHNPLRIATLRCFIPIVRFLVENAGVDPAKDGRVLHVAAMSNLRNKDLIRYLVEKGADVNQEDPTLGTPLMVALFDAGDMDFIQFLVERLGADPSYKCQNGEQSSPLHKAAEKSDPELIQFLLEKGGEGAKALLNLPDSRYFSPLMYAVISTNRHKDQVVKILLENGADVNFMVPEKGYTALFLAVQHGYTDIADILCKAGADVNIQSPKETMNCTPFHIAVSNNHLQLSELLLKYGAAVDITDSRGYTPLMMSASENYITGVDLLIKHGANLDIQAVADGKSALIHAVEKNAAPVVGLLLEHGANKDLKTYESNETALDIAKKDGKEEIVRLLEEEPFHNFKDKLKAAGKCKDEGNNFFMNKDYSQAIGKYSEALMLLAVNWVMTDEEKKHIGDIILSCHNNIAMCELKRQQFESAKQHASVVLQIQPNNAKALFRRSQAHFELGDAREAKKDVVAAIKLQPQNKDLRSFYEKVKAAVAKK